MKEGNELHGERFNCIGYHWLNEHTMQALGSSVS